MLTSENTILVIVDVQGRLAQLMDNKMQLFERLQWIIRGARALDIPILWLEQIPEKLGPTIPEIAELMPNLTPMPKISFSGARCAAFMTALTATGRRQVLLGGIEAHICVYQTAVELVAAGFEVQVAADAVSSRSPENKEIGLRRMQSSGVVLTTVEMALFELLGAAEGPAFRQIIRMIR